MIKDYCNDTALLPLAAPPIESCLVGSWMSELDNVRTMKGYTFYPDGSGQYFLWYSYEEIYAPIAAFSYRLEKSYIVLVFENFVHRYIIPFKIEQDLLTLKRKHTVEMFRKYKFG